jgi:hypothetical protein
MMPPKMMIALLQLAQRRFRRRRQMQLFSCPSAEVIGQSTKGSSPAAETRPGGGIHGVQFSQDL